MSEQDNIPGPTNSGRQDSQWERDLISRVAFAALNEQRRARRWSIFFKLLVAAYFIIVLVVAMSNRMGGPDGVLSGQITALVNMEGVIASDMPASADMIVTGLRAAFEDKRTAGVILRINSPGGSPVQAGYINDEITRLRAKYPDIPIYAVITDVCASGGYYTAVAADKIYADKASVVGSIGVLMDGFGFVGSLEKLGIERRLLTAGEHKGFLDPFSPAKPDDVAHVEGLLKEIHRQFIDTVKSGRGERLKDDPDIFSGLIWTGEQAIELGLVDALGSSSYVAREIIGAEKIVDFTPQPDLFERFAKGVGVSMAKALSMLSAQPTLK